jgi:hypothetical protein
MHTKSKIQLSTADGQDSDELIAKCHGFLCLSGQTLDTNVHFVLPPGYQRHAFSQSVDPGLSAGGFAEWANQDAYDATIHLHAWADAISTCTVRVWEVTAIEE